MTTKYLMVAKSSDFIFNFTSSPIATQKLDPLGPFFDETGVFGGSVGPFRNFSFSDNTFQPGDVIICQVAKKIFLHRARVFVPNVKILRMIDPIKATLIQKNNSVPIAEFAFSQFNEWQDINRMANQFTTTGQLNLSFNSFHSGYFPELNFDPRDLLSVYQGITCNIQVELEYSSTISLQ